MQESSIVKMMNNRVLVEPQHNSELSDGGIYTGEPTTTFTQHAGKDRQVCMGKVISVGPGKRHPKTGVRLPTGLKPGDYVAFSDTCHRPAGVQGKDWITLRDNDVMFVSDKPIEHCSVIYRD